MGVDSQGWLSWAHRLPGPAAHLNPGASSVRGIFMHSAEGYASVLLDPNSEWGFNGNHSWHLSNLMDGRVVQHYPLTARCWHATKANQEYVGVENEGDYPKEQSLNAAQIANARRFIADIAAWKGWTPSRPRSPTDTTHTLWEHNEVTRLGGSGSSCPSGRIPWDAILAGGQTMPVENYVGELVQRRARETINYHLMHGTLRVRFAPDGGFLLTGPDGVDVKINLPIVAGAEPG